MRHFQQWSGLRLVKSMGQLHPYRNSIADQTVFETTPVATPHRFWHNFPARRSARIHYDLWYSRSRESVRTEFHALLRAPRRADCPPAFTVRTVADIQLKK